MYLRRSLPLLAIAAAGLVLAACSSRTQESKSASIDPKYGVSASERVIDGYKKPVPKGGGHYKVGKPYKIAGKTYVPREQPNYDSVGMASWYGEAFHGRKTANGEIYDMHTFSAAHPTLPLPSYVRVTNLANNRSVVVRVNDRGPYAHNREIDLSKRTAQVLDFQGKGLTKVRVQYVGKAPLEGDDTEWLTTTARVDDGSSSSTLLAATIPTAPANMPQARPVAFSHNADLPSAGIGETYSRPRRRGVFGLLTGYSVTDRTADTIDAAFAAFEPAKIAPLPTEFKESTSR